MHMVSLQHLVYFQTFDRNLGIPIQILCAGFQDVTLFFFLVPFQALGPDDCIANVSLSEEVIVIPPGTVCVQCIINGALDTDAQFGQQGLNIDPTKGLTVDGVLVLFQTENVFVPNINTILRCFSSSGSTQAVVVFISKSY